MAGYLASPVFRQVVEVQPHGPGISHAEAFLLYLTQTEDGSNLQGCARDLAEHEALSAMLKEFTLAGDPLFDLRSPRVYRLGGHRFASLLLPEAVWKAVQVGVVPSEWPSDPGPHQRVLYAGGRRFLFGRIPEEGWEALLTAARLPWLEPAERRRCLAEAGLALAWVDFLEAT
jgi:hypothetical protein